MAAKAFSIGVSFLMLFQSLQISALDVLQIEKLWEHIDLHQREYGDGLFAFFSKHYGELTAQHSKQKDPGHGDHGKLPFKHSTQASSLQVIAVQPMQHGFLDELHYQIIEPLFHYRCTYSFLRLAEIFQPPRTV